MAYTNAWSSLTPIGSTVLAANIDEEIRKLKVDIEQRMNDVIGNTNWSTSVDPVINGTTSKSITTLTSEVNTKAGLNSANGFIPIRNSTSTFGNSPISVSGSNTTINSNLVITGTLNAGTSTQFNGVTYTWPTSATNGHFLQYNAGVLSWVSVAAAGAIGGSGTTGQLAVFSASASIQSTGITVSGTTISSVSNIVTDAATISTLLTVNNASVTNLVAGAILQTGSGSSIVAQGYVGTSVHYKVGANQVVGARIGSWGVPTGASSKATFNPSTVTLSELGERVSAIINDLTTHGLIGA